MARRWAGMSWRGVAFGLVMAGVSWTALAGAPSVYPTGTTIYHPEEAWNGYTVFITPESEGVILIDMNGRVVKQWTGLSGAAGVIYLIATRNREERLPGSEPHHYPVHIHVPVHAGSGSAMEQPPIYVPRPPVRPGPAMEHHPINVPRPPVRPAFRWWTFRVR